MAATAFGFVTESDLIVARNYGNRSGTNLVSIVANIGDRDCTLLLDGGEWDIQTDVTIPSNIVLRIAPDSPVNVYSGVTFTVDGPLDAGQYQIVSSMSSGIWAGASHILYRWPEWGDATTNLTNVIVLTDYLFNMSAVSNVILNTWWTTNLPPFYTEMSNLISLASIWTHGNFDVAPTSTNLFADGDWETMTEPSGGAEIRGGATAKNAYIMTDLGAVYCGWMTITIRGKNNNTGNQTSFTPFYSVPDPDIAAGSLRVGVQHFTPVYFAKTTFTTNRMTIPFYGRYVGASCSAGGSTTGWFNFIECEIYGGAK